MEQFLPVLPVLPLLACPLGMGIIMWLMSRKGQGRANEARDADEVARLRLEVTQMRASHETTRGEAPVRTERG